MINKCDLCYLYIFTCIHVTSKPMVCYLSESQNPAAIGNGIQYFFLVSGADSLCGRLTEKLNSSDGHRLVLAHMPLLMVCLEVGVYII